MAKPRVKTKFSADELPKNFFSLFHKEALVLANNTTREFAAEAEKRAREIIENQQYNWEPLTDAYLDYKRKEGLDERIYIATSDFINNGIGSWEIEGRIFVGPMPGTHKPSGLTYVKLSRIHEFGTWFIPARPLWRPLLSELLGRRKSWRRQYNRGVDRAFKQRVKKSKKTRRG